MHALTKKPELGEGIAGYRHVGKHAFAVEHSLTRDLRWTFQSAEPASGQMSFNVECLPRRKLGLGASGLVDAHRSAGLRGTASESDGRLVFSLPWGHESQAHELLQGGLLGNNVREFGVDGMLLMMELLGKYGHRVILRPLPQAPLLVGLIERRRPLLVRSTVLVLPEMASIQQEAPDRILAIPVAFALEDVLSRAIVQEGQPHL